MKKKAGLAFWLYLCLICSAAAQRIDYPKTNQYWATVGTYLTTRPSTPFWLRANQYGVVPITSPTTTFRVGASSDYAKPLLIDSVLKKKRFDWGYGVEVVGNVGRTNQILLPEAYVKARYSFIELYAGRRRTVMGLVDTALTSGSYIWSGNSLPIPVVQIGTPGFVAVPLTNQVVSLYAMYNHGWFGNSGRVKDSYLHQKALYGRLGRPSWKVKIYAGINHQVQWGGRADFLPADFTNNGALPTGLKNYWLAVTARRGATLTDTSLAAFEENRIGNHLGTLDVAAEFQLGHFNLFVYRQSIYEDGSLFYLTNIQDGLNGIRLKNQRSGSSAFRIREVIVESLYTKSQGGAIFNIGINKQRGRDNYFNHSQYQDGWTYFNRTIGTPFLTPGTEVRQELKGNAIVNNRISMVYFGLSGTIGNRLEWTGRLAYSKNFGTYDNPYPSQPGQLSSLLSVSFPVTLSSLGDWHISTSVANDQGQLLYNSTGVYVGLKKLIETRRAQPIRE